MPFGVFVELAPDCSGLIHVSRVSDTYVEDLHEAVQVGDVVTAWVTGIEEKRRRVALSAVSPEREAELNEARRIVMIGLTVVKVDAVRPGVVKLVVKVKVVRPEVVKVKVVRPEVGKVKAVRPVVKVKVVRPEVGKVKAVRPWRRWARSRRSGRWTPGGGRGRDQGRGGRSRDGGRGRGARGRDKKPESYRVVGKKETKPISDAMQKGDEPLRSFGDLMQFYTGPGDADAAKASKSDKKKTSQTSPSPWMMRWRTLLLHQWLQAIALPQTVIRVVPRLG